MRSDLSKVFNILVAIFSFFYKYIAILISLFLEFVERKSGYIYFLSKAFYLSFMFFIFFFFIYGFELFEEFVVSLGLTIFLFFIFFGGYFSINGLLVPFKLVIKLKFIELLLQLAGMIKNIINYFIDDLRLWNIYYQLFLEEEKVIIEDCNTRGVLVFSNKNFVTYKVLLVLNQLLTFYNLWFLDIFFFKRYFIYFFLRLCFFYRLKADIIMGEEHLFEDVQRYLK